MMEKGAKFPLAFSIAIFLISAALWNCKSSPSSAVAPAPSSSPGQTLPEPPPELPPPPPIRELQPSAPRPVKVISEGNEGRTQTSLIEASRIAKAKKKSEGEVRPVIEITDENLKDFSNGGQVFLLEVGGSDPDRNPPLEPNGVQKEAATNQEPGVGEPLAEKDRELFWRQSVSELRVVLRREIAELQRIELESTLLRQQFYSESDPFVRDSEIKPRWDRALDQLSSIRKKAKEDHDALISLLAEAKKAGVPAEWLLGAEAELTGEELMLINGSSAQQ